MNVIKRHDMINGDNALVDIFVGHKDHGNFIKIELLKIVETELLKTTFTRYVS
jgi:hypothetical protein